MAQFGRSAVVSFLIVPTTNLAANTIYAAIRNTSESQKACYLTYYQPQLLFAGTTGANVSAFALQKVAASPTDGTVQPYTKLNPSSADLELEVRTKNDGLNIAPNASNLKFAPRAITALAGTLASPPALPFTEDNPLIWVPGECIVLVALTNIVNGTRLAADFIVHQDA